MTETATTTDQILTASAVITMDAQGTRAQAVAVDSATGTITGIGTLADLRAAHPDAAVTDLGDAVLLPGLIDAHSHPVLSGMMCQEPAHWIAPYVGFPSYEHVTELFRKLEAETPAGQGLVFNGLDRSLQGAPELTNADLDVFFPDRPVFILDNSGHEGYFNSAVIARNGWVDGKPPADPVGGLFGRNADGTSNGRAYEISAVFAALGSLLGEVIPDPLLSAAMWYRRMAQNGITATTEHTFSANLRPAIDALASLPHSPLRLSIYHMSTEADAGEPIPFAAPDDMVRRVGIKLWADGSPWVGNIALTFPYLDNETVRGAGITPGAHGIEQMNYTREQLDALLERFGGSGLQMAFHANGDLAFDVVLDAYEKALTDHGLLGTEHGWRVEHVGAARADQFGRAASLGVRISLAPFHFIYWGDLLDGVLFESSIGSQWQRFADAENAGTSISFHNDGTVSPPIPLKNVQAAVTRRTESGALHGPEQRIDIDRALRAHTSEAAIHVGRGDEIGSIEVGKRADFAVLSRDPYAADPEHLTEQVTVLGTWRGGVPIDLDAFIAEVSAIDPAQHRDALHEQLAAQPAHNH